MVRSIVANFEVLKTVEDTPPRCGQKRTGVAGLQSLRARGGRRTQLRAALSHTLDTNRLITEELCVIPLKPDVLQTVATPDAWSG